MRGALSILFGLCLSASALAEDEGARQAREELERQLKDMVRIPPPQLEVTFNGIDAQDYQLIAATFTLDDQALPVAEAELTHGKVLFSGTLTAGPHVFASQVTYKEDPRTVFSYMSGTKFKVPGRVEFTAQRGLRLHIRAGVHVDSTADLQHRLKPANKLEPEMLAQLDDGSIPEAPRRRKIEVEAVDAGAPVAVASADVTPPPEEPESTPTGKRGHGTGRSRKGVVAQAGPERHPTPEPVSARPEPPTPPSAVAEPADAGPPVVVAKAEPAVEVHPQLPAQAATDEGLSFGAKLAIIGGVALAALLLVTVFLKTRR